MILHALKHACLGVSVILACSSTLAEEKSVTIVIDAKTTRPEINPFIYGQFIEHLGRCIYGGIWAEMLEDRKFYFPVTRDYAPYKSLTDTDFPVVGSSPWQIIGEADGVQMVSDNSFVGDHTPQVDAGHGIRQRDLGVVASKTYQGYVWLSAAEGAAGPVEITLVVGDAPRPRHVVQRVSGDYRKYDFRFAAPADSIQAMLEIRVLGQKPVRIGTASLMPADNVRRMRADTLALLKQLNAPIYRWPGGNFVSGYEWRDGIGPRDKRPPRKNPAWTGVEHNDVGIDEFIDFCREVDAEPMIAANTGFGDAYSAAQEVEYCNASTDTIAGQWRAENGHAEPFGVTYWCVGNEMFGAWQLGFMQLSHYTQKHNRVAQAMRNIDPQVQLVGVGELGGRNPKHDPNRGYGWSEGMLRESGDHMEYLSEHFYRGRTPWNEADPEKSVVAHVALLKDAIREKSEGHRQLQKRLDLPGDRLIPIAMDEWNFWHRDYVYGELGCRYDLADALGVAAGLHEYFRNSDIVTMAHYAQTVNVIGCVKTTKTDAFLASTALPLMIYRQHFGTMPLAVTGDHSKQHVDVVAALTQDRSALTIGVVNPNQEPVTIAWKIDGIVPRGQGTRWLVTGDEPQAYNTVADDRLKVLREGLPYSEQWTAPGYSFAVLRFPIQ